MNNNEQLQRKRAEQGKDLSRRNFQQTMIFLRCFLHWKKVHLEGTAMMFWYRLMKRAFQLLAWHKPYEPPLVDATINPNASIGLRGLIFCSAEPPTLPASDIPLA